MQRADSELQAMLKSHSAADLGVSRSPRKGAGPWRDSMRHSRMQYCYSVVSRALSMNFTLECEQEVDGRWIAEVPELPGVLAYGSTSSDAMSKAEVLALRVIADRLENGESEPVSIRFSLPLSA